jgi:hypothetical protein
MRSLRRWSAWRAIALGETRKRRDGIRRESLRGGSSNTSPATTISSRGEDNAVAVSRPAAPVISVAVA